MKITDLELVPASKYLFIKLHTDEGIVGIGEVGAWGYIDGTEGVLNKLKDYIVGQDPFKIEHHWQYMYRSMYFRGSVIMSAIAAIDIALWDIKGKALGVPVYELLGGKCRDKVRSYPAVFKFTAETMAAECIRLKEKGFTAARLMITGDMRKPVCDFEDSIFNYKIEKYVDMVRACREAVGQDFDLCLEVHRSMTPAEAISFANAVEKYNPLFIEDPIAPDNIDVMAEVANKINIPVSTGERYINIQEFEMLMSRKGARYVRPDLCALGGITPSKKVASMAEANYVGIIPHNPLGPVSTAACLQLDAAIPNLTIQEFPSFYESGDEGKMIKEPLVIENGYIIVPDKPGIGIELVENITELFPPQQRSIRAQIAYDGSVVDI